MNQVGQYNNRDYQISRVYFTNTATLKAGQALCYQENPASSTTTGLPSTTITDTAAAKGFPFDVQLPDANSLKAFAGIVAPNSVGVTGPAYIDMIVPRTGDIVQVRATRANSSLSILGDFLVLFSTVGNNTSTSATAWSGYGAWGLLSSAMVSSTDYAIANVLSNMSQMNPLVRNLETVVSTATTGDTSLIWVKFVTA